MSVPHDHEASLVKWDRRFLSLAKHVSTWSKDPSTKTGAAIVRPNRTICSVGYNGFPRWMDDSRSLYDDRETKYSRIIHCELNAILTANEQLSGYTLFTYPFLSCDRCAVHVIQAGIKRVVAPELPDHLKCRWENSINRSISYFREAGVKVRFYDGFE